MSLLDYSRPKTRQTWRIGAAAALCVGIAGLALGYWLTIEVIRHAASRPDAVHSFLVAGRYYVSPGLGLARNLVLMIAIALSLTAAVVLLHRELRWWFWDRYINRPSP